MNRYLAAYGAAVPAMMALDLLWLGVAAKDLYRRNLAHLMGTEVHWWAAALFYLVYAAGIVYFAVLPGLEGKSLAKSAANGALLGLLVYAVYDLTNLALLRDWPLALSALDILWGGLATCVVAAAAYLAAAPRAG
jgi:uncharacterized membrane protein